jgi:iron(III) transport system ATP-binding protein
MAGLEMPERGRIMVGGKSVFNAAKGIALAPEARNIGLVFQSYALWPHMTVTENVAFGLKLRGVSGAEQKQRVSATLEKIGLGHLGDRYPFQLSGGQQQRVAICRALVYEPSVILLDEPLSNLDAKLREEARFWIRKLILDLGLCAVVVTHDQSEALAMSDRVLLLKEGSIIQDGTPMELYDQPTSRYAAEFLGTNNVVDGEIAIEAGQAVIRGPGWSLAGRVRGGNATAGGGRGTAVIRMERVRLVDGPGPNRIEMQADASLYLGGHWEHRLTRDGLQLRAAGDAPLGAGTVWCEVAPNHVWIFPS